MTRIMEAACSSAAAARPHLDAADAVFLDINMPDLSGMDFIKSLPHPPAVVFTTAYSEYAVEGFRVNAVDYLLKPFSFNEFLASWEKLRQHLEMKAALAALEPEPVLHFRADYHMISIEVRKCHHFVVGRIGKNIAFRCIVIHCFSAPGDKVLVLMRDDSHYISNGRNTGWSIYIEIFSFV